MLYYDRIDVSERIDVNKASASKERYICHYWYSLNYVLKFQPNVCSRCHDLLMSVNLSNIAILQTSAYKACNHTRTPLHTPKTLETCKN